MDVFGQIEIDREAAAWEEWYHSLSPATKDAIRQRMPYIVEAFKAGYRAGWEAFE